MLGLGTSIELILVGRLLVAPESDTSEACPEDVEVSSSKLPVPLTRSDGLSISFLPVRTALVAESTDEVVVMAAAVDRTGLLDWCCFRSASAFSNGNVRSPPMAVLSKDPSRPKLIKSKLVVYTGGFSRASTPGMMK